MSSSSSPRKRSSGETRGGDNCGKRGAWSQRANGAYYAQLQYDLRQKRKRAKYVADEGDRVREAARRVVEQTYGGPLPLDRKAPLPDYKPLSADIGPNILTSADQDELMADLNLIAKATAEQWPITPDIKRLVVARTTQVLTKSEGVRDELYLKAAEILIKIDRSNAHWLGMANPQKHQHEHLHVELQQPTVDERRSRLIETVDSLLLGGATGEPGEDAGGASGDQCIDVGG